MKLSAARVMSLVFVVASWVMAAAFYDKLPNPVPTHWNLHGVVNGTMAKPWGGIILPLEMTGVWLLFLIAPVISPRGFRIEPFRRVFDILQVSLLGMFLVGTVSNVVASGPSLLPVVLGAFLILAGNFMGKVTRNFFIGIRTPWTLASEEVWLQTHRFAGKVMMAAGVFIAVIGALGFTPRWVLGGTVLVATVIPIVYSFVVYRRLEGFAEPQGIGSSVRHAGAGIHLHCRGPEQEMKDGFSPFSWTKPD